MQHLSRYGLAPCSILLLLALAACAPGATTTTPGSEATNTTTAQSEATSTTTTTTGAQLPSDIPAYPGAHYLQGVVHGSSAVYIFTTSDSPEKVLAFYQQAMPAQGWSPTSTRVLPNDPIRQFSKGARHTMVQAGPSTGVVAARATTITITVSG